MKIITWNVNGIRAVERKGALQELIEKESPDVLFLQEIKGKVEQFSAYLSKNADYRQFYHSAEKPGYAGTAIWIRYDLLQGVRRVNFNMHVPHLKNPYSDTGEFIQEPRRGKRIDDESEVELGGKAPVYQGIPMLSAPNMDEGRVSHLSFLAGGVTYDLASIYFPNGGKSEEAWNNKLVFFDKVLDYMNALRNMGHKVIVGGDMNVAHKEIDLARPKENDGNIGFHPKERAWMDKVIEADWVDVWRYENPDVEEMYSWWDVKSRARERNVGWRIDYFLMDKQSAQKVTDVKYLTEQMGSDHCPLMLEI
ncbi:MAG: exodeoxyribonuclease III [Patescibacteria group bacterium]